MHALETALALAVSMLVFSSLATMVVEIIYKVFNLRRLGLKISGRRRCSSPDDKRALSVIYKKQW